MVNTRMGTSPRARAPYSIYTRNRPLRIAFFVKSERESIDAVDSIVEYNQHMWGGRFNPIILTDGRNVNEEQWRFLHAYDPDVVKLTVGAEQSLIDEIGCRLSPYLVEPCGSVGNVYHDIRVRTDGLRVIPTYDEVIRLAGPVAENPKLAAFFVTREAPDDVRRFVVHNFARYEHVLRFDNAVRKLPHRKFEIDGVESLAAALEELADNTVRETLVLPVAHCGSNCGNLRAEYASIEEDFTVIIGDAIENVVYCWNRGFFQADSRFPVIRQVWIPRGLSEDPKISAQLQSFLQTMAWKVDGSSQLINVMSHEIQEEQLREIATGIKPQFFSNRIYGFKGGRVPKMEKSWKPIDFADTSCDLHRASGNVVQLRVARPELARHAQSGHWMVDTFIEHASDNYRGYSSSGGFWWKLPPRNTLARAMFSCPARICGNGIPAVLANTQSPFMTVTLPSDISIFRNLVLSRSRDVFFTVDARRKAEDEAFDDMGRSDKGRYLSGVLELFGGIVTAGHYFESRYWRKMFSLLSRCDDSKEGRIVDEIQNKLRKRLNAFKDNPARDVEFLESLSRHVLQVGRRYGVRPKELTYEDFLREALHELQSYLLQENSIRPPALQFTLAEVTDAELAGPCLSEKLRRRFAENCFALSERAKIIGPGSNGRWVVTDDTRCRFFILVRNEALDIYEYTYDERDLEGRLFDLSSCGVLLSGIRAPCPHCGSGNWHHVSELRQDLLCNGCSQSYNLPVQPEWRYRLNSLVQAGCFEHGLSPIVLLLGELLLFPSASFFYAPCMELFEKSAETPYGDLDILCIQDGRFIIGEVKQSVSLFRPRDFEKMAEIAERICPDELLFSSMDPKPNKTVSEGIINLEKRLSPQGIKVKWHALSRSNFEPVPVI